MLKRRLFYILLWTLTKWNLKFKHHHLWLVVPSMMTTRRERILRSLHFCLDKRSKWVPWPSPFFVLLHLLFGLFISQIIGTATITIMVAIKSFQFYHASCNDYVCVWLYCSQALDCFLIVSLWKPFLSINSRLTSRFSHMLEHQAVFFPFVCCCGWASKNHFVSQCQKRRLQTYQPTLKDHPKVNTAWSVLSEQ